MPKHVHAHLHTLEAAGSTRQSKTQSNTTMYMKNSACYIDSLTSIWTSGPYKSPHEEEGQHELHSATQKHTRWCYCIHKALRE